MISSRLALSAFIGALSCCGPLAVAQPDPHHSGAPAILETLVVTATQEEARLADTAASVGVLSQADIESVIPTHSAELLNRIPGINIQQLGSSGEGTAAAIRQPTSYGPVYLYLENGVPTRSAAFFNHNALYEVNVAGAGGVEIIKGPGSALYGSDAMGAVINILSGRPPQDDRFSLGLEGGEHGWQRLRLNADKVLDNQGFTLRADLNANDGWRERTDSRRQSLTSSWNIDTGDSLSINSVFTFTRIDLHTGGSGLSYDDFHNDSDKAGNQIGYRDVEAYRLSSAFTWDLGEQATLTLTPFARHNELAYVASWTLNTGRAVTPRPWQCEPVVPGVPCVPTLDSQDAHINESGHDSVGAQLRYRRELGDGSFWITGLDTEYSRGDQRQTHILRTDDDPGRHWLAFTEGELLYDYDVDFSALSPYVHTSFAVTDKLRLSAGLRYDHVRYDYENRLSTDLDDPIHKRPADTAVTLEHLSPKLDATYQISDTLNAYAAYRHAFRIPSAGQLFRAGQTVDSTDLEPVIADSFELGLRGSLGARIAFESALYYMIKQDDIISVSDLATGGRRNVNAGETEHYGVELGVETGLTDTLTLGLAYTYTEHKFKEWVDRSGDFSGNDMPNAPQDFGNLRLNYTPTWLRGGRVELEWFHQGEHWLDEQNDDDGRAADRDSYNGHDLLNLRANYRATDSLDLYVRVLNLTDERYAETTSKWGPLYTPGRPRTAYAGFNYAF